MKLVLVRHGESIANKENIFTGWLDSPLSDKGIEEAKAAGKQLQADGIVFDEVYTSLLQRAIKTTNLLLEEMAQLYLPVTKSWRLNERHYGALQGLNKTDTAKKYGDEQVLIWRRSYDVAPPLLENEVVDRRYAMIDTRKIPHGESLKTTLARVLPFWDDHIAPSLLANKNVLVAAHGNSLRALIKYLEHIDDDEIIKLNLPTGQPIIYELDDKLQVISRTGL